MSTTTDPTSDKMPPHLAYFTIQRGSGLAEVSHVSDAIAYAEAYAAAKVAEAVAAERERLLPLLKRAQKHLFAWAEWYGKHDGWRKDLPLPPAGDVRLAEDISEAMKP